MMRSKTLSRLLLCPLLATPVLSSAASFDDVFGNTVQCLAPPPPVIDSKKGEAKTKFDIPTKLSADSMESFKEIYILRGNVEIKRDNMRITADSLSYDRTKDIVESINGVTLETSSGDRIKTNSLHYQLKDGKGKAGASEYLINGRIQSRGDAKEIEFIEKGVMRLKRLRYTTCPANKESWHLSVRDLKVDKNAGFAIAKHVTLKIKKIPIFYFPYLKFPINDQRVSGFLFPKLGRSDKLGTIIAVPYYWNIAPQYDATITPRILSRRGLQLQTQFRYLGTHSGGELAFEALPNDDVTGSDRSAGKWVHRQSFSPYWSSAINLRGVSDDRYLDDFGDSLAIASQTHLPSEADLTFRGKVWMFSTRLSHSQVIDEAIAVTDEPYDRLPQVLLSANKAFADGRLRAGFDSEWVDFEHETNLTGKRLNVHPYLSFPFRNSYGFIIPKFSAHHISYDLDRSTNKTPDVTTSMFSLDTGLIFERQGKIGKRELVQTIEPRLFFLRVPYEDQDLLPLFDTGLPDFNFDTLFRENRFVGGDRVGDAKQATLAVSSRFLDANSGAELFRISLGQIYFFEDQRVSIPAGTLRRNSSNLVLEAAARLPGNWYLRNTWLWDKELHQTQKATTFLQYNPGKNKIFNFSHRFVRGDDKQIDISTQWPIGNQWIFQARTNYSLKLEQNIESYLGFAYKSCCWGIRLFARQRVDRDGRQNNAILLQIQFAGLGKLGDAPSSPLSKSVFFTKPD